MTSESRNEAASPLVAVAPKSNEEMWGRDAFPADKSLNLRRAIFVYDAARLAAQMAYAPVIPVPWADREQEFKDQFLTVIALQCGPRRSSSPEELHGSWMQAYVAMGWTHGEEYSRENKVHPDLIPYAQLGQLEKDKDAVFVRLCEIARLWIYDLPSLPEGQAAKRPNPDSNIPSQGRDSE